MDNAFYKHWKLVPKAAWFWPNFTPAEIACKGTGELVIDFEAMDALQGFRLLVGVPFSPNSAYRSEAHNKKVGGAKNSQHRKGRAFDIPISKTLTREAIKAAAAKCGFQGIGDYNNFVHIDLGPKRYWDYRKNVV